jgi:hypothetical protein
VFKKLEFQDSRRPKFQPIGIDPVVQRVDADGFKARDAGTAENQFLKHVQYTYCKNKNKFILTRGLISAGIWKT